MTLRATVADTSSCSLTDTSWAPSDLIGLSTTIVRLSTCSPDASLSALGDVGDGDGAEQPTTRTGADLDADRLAPRAWP